MVHIMSLPIWYQADDRTRTDTLLITQQLLCQLSHIGKLCNMQLIRNQPALPAIDAVNLKELSHIGKMTPTGIEPVLPP